MGRKKLFEKFQESCLVQEDIWFGRCCLRLFSSMPSLISEWNISFILSLNVAWCLPLSFCSREYVGWKKLFEKFQEDCLVHDHLLYLSGMKEAFLSLFLVWSIKSSFCSWGHMAWKKMFFWRISRLLFSSSSSLRSELKWFFIYSEPPCCLLYAQEDVWIWRRNCLKNSKMTV